MKNIKTRVLAVALAAVSVLSISVTAFAGGPIDENSPEPIAIEDLAFEDQPAEEAKITPFGINDLYWVNNVRVTKSKSHTVRCIKSDSSRTMDITLYSNAQDWQEGREYFKLVINGSVRMADGSIVVAPYVTAGSSANAWYSGTYYLTYNNPRPDVFGAGFSYPSDNPWDGALLNAKIYA